MSASEQTSDTEQAPETEQTGHTALSLNDVEVGQQLPSRTTHIERASLVQYTGASLDRNPLH